MNSPMYPVPEAHAAKSRSFLKIGLVMVLLALVGFVQPAMACGGPPPMPPNVWIIFQSRTTVWIVFHKYITFGANPGQFCACGLNQVGPITGFTSAQFVDSSTGKPIAGFDFAPNDTVGKSFGQVAPVIGTLKQLRSGQVVPSVAQAPWGGFLSSISQTVPVGISYDLWICVTVVPGTTFGQLAQALSAQGQIGTSAANSDGTLVSGHTAIVRPGTIMNMSTTSVVFPQADEQ
jgi:hypothetical protein